MNEWDSDNNWGWVDQNERRSGSGRNILSRATLTQSFSFFPDFPSSASSSSSHPDESDSGLSGLDLNDSSGSVSHKLIHQQLLLQQQQQQLHQDRVDSGLSGIILEQRSSDQDRKTNWSRAGAAVGDEVETQSLEGLSQSLSSVATLSRLESEEAGGARSKKKKTSSDSSASEELRQLERRPESSARNRSREEDVRAASSAATAARSWAVSSPALSAPPNLNCNFETDQNRMVLKQLPR